MRAVVQKVTEASVTVDKKTVGKIGKGVCVFVGVENGDNLSDVDYIAKKITGLRIFEDSDNEGKMNLSVSDVLGKVLLISQFTLLGDARKGKRPSFMGAEKPDKADEVFNSLVEEVKKTGLKVQTGTFKAHMDVHILNDGPVTILLDSRRLF